MPPCPAWCTLPAGHGWDTVRGGRASRGHQGPMFGAYVSTGAHEFKDAWGAQVYDLSIASEVERDVVTSIQAVELARDLLGAAQWIMDRKASRA
jgi:hypothetical protein